MEPAQAFRNSSTKRSEFFNKLKPCCLDIVRALRQGNGSDDGTPATAAHALVTLTEQLYGILTAQVDYDSSILDPSLADYVFFPLLHIFQHLDDYPARLIENATKCLRVLIQHGWRTAISKDNAQQFLILLTSVVTGSTRPEPGKSSKREDWPEETATEGYRALSALVRAAGAAPGPVSPLVAANAIPALAHTVTVVLEGITGLDSPAAVQLEALGVVEALYTAVKDQEALAAFLPGTVSSLVRAVAAPGAQKTPKKVTARALQVLYAVLVNTLGDLQTRHIRVPKGGESTEATGEASLAPASRGAEEPAAVESTVPAAIRPKLDASWLQATTAQVQVALASVLKLRNHESEDVRDVVRQFCVGLLDECHARLAGCASILVESAIITAPEGDQTADVGEQPQERGPLQTGLHGLGPQTTLADLAILYPELADVVKTTAYHWASSLPRAMQSSDEETKQRAMRNLQRAIAILETLHVDSGTLKSTLSAALRDSVVTLIRSSASSSAAAVSEADLTDLTDLEVDGGRVGDVGDALTKQPAQSTEIKTVTVHAHTPYRPVLLGLGSQKATRNALLSMLAHIGSPSQQVQLAAEMLDFVRDSEGLDQASALWLSFELVKSSLAQSAARSAETDGFLDFSLADDDEEANGSQGGVVEVLEDLLSFSIGRLASHSDAAVDVGSGGGGRGVGDWRLDAVAMEVTAFAAARSKEAFRPELIDVLYPVATYLGSTEARLRGHAVVTLNSLAAACGYGSVSALIVSNVDYMLNSVSLRLNTFDISPASMQVLTMMIRLAGPRLVPYLDDVVAAIFAALDNYHGYPLFVESLFSVLGEVVQQSVQSSALLQLEGAGTAPVSSTEVAVQSGPLHNRKRPAAATTTIDLVEILEKRARRRTVEDESRGGGEERGHPKQPWKSEAHTLLRKKEKELKGEDGDGSDDSDAESRGPEMADKTEKAGMPDKNDLTKPEDPKTPTYALLARITTLTQHYLTSPMPTLRKSLLDLLATVAPALATSDEDAFLPLVHAVWPVMLTRLYDGEPYVVMAACEALGALCASAGDFVGSRVKAEWQGGLGRWCARAKAEAAAKMRGSRRSGKSATARAPVDMASSSPLLQIGGRPTIQSASGGAILLSDQNAADSSLVVSGSSGPSGPSGPGSSGLGRFAQAMQVWEAVSGLLTDIVTHVRLEDEIYDEVLDLLLTPAPTPAAAQSLSLHDRRHPHQRGGRRARLLPEALEQRAREALAVVNADAVWLAELASGQPGEEAGWEAEDGSTHQQPVLPVLPALPALDGVCFATVR